MQYWIRITPPSVFRAGQVRVYRGVNRATRLLVTSAPIARQRRTSDVMDAAVKVGRALIRADQERRVDKPLSNGA